MAFYDVDKGELRELWESYLIEPFFSPDASMGAKDEDCGHLLCMRDSVVLRDRLMTDAALGGPRPIKSEHSYSLLISSPPPSPTKPGGSPYTPNSDSDAVGLSAANTGSSIDFTNLDHKPLDIRKIDDFFISDMEEEYFTISAMNAVSNRGESLPSTSTMILKTEDLTSEVNVCPEIKDEPISAPASPSCVPSQSSCDMLDTYDKNIVVTNLSTLEERKLVTRFGAPQTSDSDDEEDDEEYCQNMEVEDYEELCEKNEASHSSRQELPPTPPSSGEDSEGTASCSPERRDSQTSTDAQNHKGLPTPRYYQVANGTHATRQPIHTPLISCQPKGSTGVLTLTEEEKRTLIAEGYPVPTKLPLTKQEEKSLKKVRRKIKNKISAQESRRKKKEYMDGLERRVTMLMSENTSYRDRLNNLEEINRNMQKEVQRLQALLQQQQS